MFGEAGVETGGPIHIEIGRTGLKGWDKALAGMCKGDKKRAFLPPDLAYGSEGLKECGKDEEVCSHYNCTHGKGRTGQSLALPHPNFGSKQVCFKQIHKKGLRQLLQTFSAGTVFVAL